MFIFYQRLESLKKTTHVAIFDICYENLNIRGRHGKHLNILPIQMPDSAYVFDLRLDQRQSLLEYFIDPKVRAH